MTTYIKHSDDDSLTHFGVKGMKWKKGRKTRYDLNDRKYRYDLNDPEFQERMQKRRKEGPQRINTKSPVYQAEKKMAAASRVNYAARKMQYDVGEARTSKLKYKLRHPIKAAKKSANRGRQRLERIRKYGIVSHDRKTDIYRLR